MEVDLTFELTESRELKVRAYVNPSGPEFSQIYTPTNRDVHVKRLAGEIDLLEARLEQEQSEAITNENYETAEKLRKLHTPIRQLRTEAMLLTTEDTTDDRYKLADQKRALAQQLYQLTSGKRLDRLRAEYQELKEVVTETVNESGNDQERAQLREVSAREHTVLSSNDSQKLEAAIDQLHRIQWQILRRTPEFLVSWFHCLIEKREMFNDQFQATNLIEAGKKHIATEDYERLKDVNSRLLSLLPQREQNNKQMQHFTGIRMT